MFFLTIGYYRNIEFLKRKHRFSLDNLFDKLSFETIKQENMYQLEIILQRLDEIEEMLTNENTIMNIDEVCKFTRISKSTMYKLTSSNKIPHYKKTKHLIFDKKEIMLWIREGQVRTQKEIGIEN